MASRRPATFLLFSIALGGISASARGQMLFEPFNYTAGNIEGATGGGSFGFFAAWDDTATSPEISVPSPGGLTSTAYTSRGFAQVGLSLKSPVGAGANDDFIATRQLSTAISLDADATHYYSFLVKGDWTTLGNSRGFNVGFTASATGLSTNAVTIKKNFNTTTLIAAVGGNNTVTGQTSGIPDNEVRFVVVKIVTSASGSDTLSFESFGASVTVPGSESFAVANVALGSLTGSLTHLIITGRVNDSGMYYEFDEIRAGSTWDSVTTPEPVSLSLLAFSSWLMGRRRRGRLSPSTARHSIRRSHP